MKFKKTLAAIASAAMIFSSLPVTSYAYDYGISGDYEEIPDEDYEYAEEPIEGDNEELPDEDYEYVEEPIESDD